MPCCLRLATQIEHFLLNTVYLNHAGTSWPKPQAVVDAASAVWGSDPSDWADQLELAHRQIASFFHVATPDQLLLTPGCTSALSIAVADHFWNAGDRVLASSFEHHALHRPLVKLSDYGVDVEILPHLDHEPIILEELESALRKGSVELVALVAACNVTGVLLPYDEVISLAHAYGAKVLIDAAQIAGWWDLDLPALGADLVAFAGHKGLQAPWGIGGLYVAPEIKMNSPAAVCELTYDKLSGKPKQAPAKPGYCDVGSVDRSALTGLAAAAQWLSHVERSDRLTRSRQLTQRLYDAAAEMNGTTLVCPSDMTARMPTVAMTFSNLRSSDAAAQLAGHGIFVAGGMQCAPLAHKSLGTAPDGVVRLSAGPNTTEDDVARAIEALERVSAS